MLSKLRRGKSLAIVLLAALAIYQTGQLWFVHMTNLNPVRYFAAFFGGVARDGYFELSRPLRVIYGNGGEHFDVRYGVSMDEARDAFRALLRGGSFLHSAPAAASAILNEPMIRYEYPFALRAEIFAMTYGRERDAALLTERGLHSFEALTITNGHIMFYDSDGIVWTFSVNGIDVAVTNILPSRQFVYDAGNFYPRRPAAPHEIVLYNPYANRGGMATLDSVNAQAAHFFDNPAMRNLHMEENVITITTRGTVVRFLPGNILEYNSFAPMRRDGAPDFLTDYSAALNFLQNDPNVINHFFLAGYELRGRAHVFWFNFFAEHGGRVFPLEIPEGGWGMAPNNLAFPVEITVSDGHVTRYRKAAYNFGVR
jgi:hypothetical protein